MHVKTGDEVLIVAGKDKGKRGKIKQALPKDGRVVVEGLNMIKRHMKQRGPGKPGKQRFVEPFRPAAAGGGGSGHEGDKRGLPDHPGARGEDSVTHR